MDESKAVPLTLNYYRMTSGATRQIPCHRYATGDLTEWWPLLLDGRMALPRCAGWGVCGRWDAQMAQFQIVNHAGLAANLHICLDAFIAEAVWSRALDAHAQLERSSGFDLLAPDPEILGLCDVPWAASLLNPMADLAAGQAFWLSEIEMSLAVATALAAGPGLPGYPGGRGGKDGRRGVVGGTAILCEGRTAR